MEAVEKLFLMIGLDTSEVDKDINKLTAKLGALVKSIAAPVAGVFSIAALGSMFQEITQEADSLAKAADRMGVAIDDLDAWGAAAKLSGGSAQGLSNTVENLSGQLSRLAVTGKSQAKPFLDKLGISAFDAAGKVKNSFALLEEIAQSIEGMDKSQSASLLRNMGIDQGTIALIQSGKKSIAELIREQKEIGVYTKRTGEIMEKYNDAIDTLYRTFKMSLLPIAEFLAESLTKNAKFAADGIKYLREHVEVFAPALSILAAVLLTKLAPALWAVIAPLLPWIALFTTLGLLFEDLVVWTRGGKSSLDDLWESLFGSPEKAQKIWEDLKASLQEFWETVQTAAPAIKEAFRELFSFAGGAVGIWIGAFTGLGNVVKLIVAALGLLRAALFGTSDDVDKALNEITARFENWKESISWIVDGVKRAVKGLWGFITGAKDAVSTIAGIQPPPGQGEALAAGASMAGAVDNRKIDTTVTQTVNVYPQSGDPNAIANSVGQVMNKNSNFTAAANYGQKI
jgi:hypothetical protein